MRPEPKISKHYATPDEVPALFDADGKRVFIEHRHIAQWFLNNDYSLSAATKYIFRAGKKQSAGMSLEEKAIEDLKKAQEYIGFKIEEYQFKVANGSVKSPEQVPCVLGTASNCDTTYPTRKYLNQD